MDFSLRSAERSAETSARARSSAHADASRRSPNPSRWEGNLRDRVKPSPPIALTPSRWEGNPTFSLLGIWLWFSQLK
jgi:hypothetical protein